MKKGAIWNGFVFKLKSCIGFRIFRPVLGVCVISLTMDQNFFFFAGAAAFWPISEGRATSDAACSMTTRTT